MSSVAQLELEAIGESSVRAGACQVVVIWIDWYPYHVARFRGLLAAPSLAGHVVGVELVGGIGVHAGLKFREPLPADLPIETIEPEGSWATANKWRLAVKLWRTLSRLEPDTVLVPGYYTVPAIAAAAWARVHGRKSVLMTESTAEDHARVGWKERVKSGLIRGLFSWAVTGGRPHLRYLDQLGFPSERIAHFYDVVDNRFFAEGADALRRRSPQEFGLPTSPYFLYVGRLAEEKNVAGLLASWMEYRSDGGTWPLVLVGGGPEEGALRAHAASSKFAAEVFFPGLRGSRELPPYYAFAGCFVLPSTREPWGLVTNEAMASGLPVIVSERCGCAEELVDETRNGVRFDPQEPGALRRALDQIAHLPEDRRRAMGAQSASMIASYSPEAFGREIARIQIM